MRDRLLFVVLAAFAFANGVATALALSSCGGESKGPAEQPPPDVTSCLSDFQRQGGAR